MPDGSDKDQDSTIHDSVHPSVLSSSQNHALPVKHNVFLWNLPDVEESLSVPSFLYVSDSPLVSMKKEKGRRTAADSVQSGWPIVAAKAKQSSRAGAANENRNLRKAKAREKHRGARAGVTFCISSSNLSVKIATFSINFY
ncbi:hypothetical protein TNCV_3152801 [Trichonephila clavipes]|nr:hypothetical protein TNCV_3152801 [Trichonephila clavipes]